MPTDKQPRNIGAKKTTKSVGNAPTNSQASSTSQPAGGTARNPMITNNAALDLEEVRRRAYELYEQEGRQGNQEEHWFRAELELRQRNGDQKKSA
jgi:DNA relaxase NicK